MVVWLVLSMLKSLYDWPILWHARWLGHLMPASQFIPVLFERWDTSGLLNVNRHLAGLADIKCLESRAGYRVCIFIAVITIGRVFI